MNAADLKPNKILRGPIFPEPVQIIVCIPMGDAVIGSRILRSESSRSSILVILPVTQLLVTSGHGPLFQKPLGQMNILWKFL